LVYMCLLSLATRIICHPELIGGYNLFYHRHSKVKTNNMSVQTGIKLLFLYQTALIFIPKLTIHMYTVYSVCDPKFISIKISYYLLLQQSNFS
jgi:hypothetical protein